LPDGSHHQRTRHHRRHLFKWGSFSC
jgi:hypothetical protein